MDLVCFFFFLKFRHYRIVNIQSKISIIIIIIIVVFVIIVTWLFSSSKVFFATLAKVFPIQSSLVPYSSMVSFFLNLFSHQIIRQTIDRNHFGLSLSFDKFDAINRNSQSLRSFFFTTFFYESFRLKNEQKRYEFLIEFEY